MRKLAEYFGVLGLYNRAGFGVHPRVYNGTTNLAEIEKRGGFELLNMDTEVTLDVSLARRD